MAIYTNLPKLGRVQLPVGGPYALIDVDGRAIIAPNFSTENSYSLGDHVIYGDNLYRAKVDNIGAGAWNSNNWDCVTIDTEIKRIEGIISGGIHYRGKTTTALFDGASTNPITIGGSSYTAEAGDMVILKLFGGSGIATAYTSGVAYAVNTYIKDSSLYYITTAAITAEENLSITAIENKLDKITSEPEFLFDGLVWNLLGSIADGLGDLAFKDTAQGQYIKPTGSGSVSIKNYTETTKYLARTTIVGTNGTIDASEVTGGTSKNQWKQDTSNSTVVYGIADVDTAVTYGTANPGEAVTGVAKVDTTQKTFITEGIVASVDGDLLLFTNSGTSGIYGVQSTGVSITPAVASMTKLTPAKAADTSRTINNLVADGTLTGSYTITARTPAAVASSPTYVATGAVSDSSDGAAVLTNLNQGTEVATVNVGTEQATITVR